MKKTWWGITIGIAVLLVLSSCGGGGGGGGDSSTTYTVGGTVTGLTGTVTLQLNGANDLVVTGDGSFTFTAAPLANGATYAVTVKETSSTTHYCAVSNGSGTISGANVTSVAVNGQLDKNFGTRGIAVGSNAAGGSGDDVGWAVTLDADKKILVVGESVNAAGNSDMVIWRYTADGVLDTTFGTDGIASFDSDDHGVANGNDAGYAITVSGGKIYVTGVIVNGSGNYDMAIWRFTADGDLDTTTFNNPNGFVKYHNPGNATSNDEGKAIRVDGSGKVVVAGSTQPVVATNTDIAVWRYKSDGTVDGSFGTGGLATYDSPAMHDDGANAMTLDANNNILVTGSSVNVSDDLDMILLKFSALDGSLDPLFNLGAGYTRYDGPANDSDAGNAIVMVTPASADSKILVAGFSKDSLGKEEMAVWRYLSDGTLDTDFSTDGVMTAGNAAGGNLRDNGIAMALDSDGKILVTGFSRNVAGEYDMALWRVTTSGILDAAFGDDGAIVDNSAAGGSYYDSGSGIVLNSADPDKRIIVCGCSQNASLDLDMILWRFYP